MGLHVTKAEAAALFKAHGFAPPEPPKRDKPSDGMNKLERQFSYYLEWERREGKIRWWKFGRVTFVLTLPHDGIKGCRLTPDFCTLDNDGVLTWWETKGWEREDSTIKRKMLAHEFPGLRFVLVKKVADEWVFSEFGAGLKGGA